MTLTKFYDTVDCVTCALAVNDSAHKTEQVQKLNLSSIVGTGNMIKWLPHVCFYAVDLLGSLQSFA